MKKVLFIAVAILGLTNAYAQEKKFGIKGGLNIASSTLSVNGLNITSVYGINIGFFGDFKISKIFSIQPEILYSMQGVKASVSNAGQFIEVTENLDYINLPVMAKLYASDKFNFQAGPQFGFLISAKDKINTNVSGSGITSGTIDVKNNYNDMEFGLNLGAGYDFSKNFSADVRYNFGLTDIEKSIPANSSVAKTRNRVLSINLGYKF